MQRRVLVRARGLASFRRALVNLSLEGDPLAARRRAVILPTRAAAELLRQTIERHRVTAATPGIVLPDLLTRDEWLSRMFTALPPGRRWLSRTERLVLLDRAARETLARRPAAAKPFRLRPGLVAAMLDFYDELRRRQRSIRRFARVLFDELRVERGTDRGSDSLIGQTAFLGFTFLAYARRAASSGGVDEHALRAALLDTQPALPFDDLVVAVADHPADPRGLWPVDFDFAGRLSRLSHIHVVVTDEVHDAGFRERIEMQLPGIEETRAGTVECAPRIVVARDGADAPFVAVSRDREEELRDVARTIRHRAAATGGVLAASTAVVFQRPLPYLYLAQQVLADARIPYQAFDALPLAGEPYAALLDVVMTMARTGGTREASLALLRSPLLMFEVDGAPIGARDVSALERVLAERRAAGEASTYPAEVAAWTAARFGRPSTEAGRAERAAAAAQGAAAALAPYRIGQRGTAQVGALSGFLRAHERMADATLSDERPRRARAAVLAVLDDLAGAFLRHDDGAREEDDLAAAIHHAIEAQTFMPARGRDGVHLVDGVAARFGEFDDTFLVGLVETDWAERERRSVFYASPLLKALGWPQDDDQSRAREAAFRDLLTLARDRTRLSAFQLEGDAIVGLSPLVEAARRAPTAIETPAPRGALFPDERWTRDDATEAGDDGTAGWLALRRERPPLAGREYGGFVPPRAPEVYRVSRVDRYVQCPFKYFAAHVLQLQEDREDEAGLTPLERGTLLHTLFEDFYRQWQAAGRGRISSDLIPEAVAMFARITEQALSSLPPADRTLEGMRLHGSMVAPGAAARVFELEADDDRDVHERLLEYELNGRFAFPIRHGLDAREIEVRGKTDRVDVLADGSLRVVDYKLGRMPDLNTSVQVSVYAHCVRSAIEQRDGAPHPVSAAMYLAFGDDRRLEGRVPGRGDDAVAMAIAAKASDFAGTVGRIEAGEFPPSPRKPGECAWCGFAGVCRKEYRTDEDEAAEPV